MKRIIINKAETMVCQLCNADISKYGMVSHIRQKHRESSVEEYVIQFGEFRKNKESATSNRKSHIIKCEICSAEHSSTGFYTHLRDSHDGLTPDGYVAMGYSEYRRDKIKNAEHLEKNNDKYECKICNFLCRNEKHLNKHLQMKHNNIDKLEYINRYVLNYVIPKCSCGCGQDVKLITYWPYTRTIIHGHGLVGELNPMFGRYHNEETSQKMKIKANARMKKVGKFRDTKPELKFRDEFLIPNNINFEIQKSTQYGRVDFYLPDYDLLVEIDGEYWHPIKCEFLNSQLIDSAIYQFRKKSLSNLIRIRENDIPKIKQISDLTVYNFNYDFKVEYNQIVIHKQYLEQYTGNKQKMTSRLYKFIESYCPEFPTVTTHENIESLQEKIKLYDYTKIFDGNTFRNNCSLLGVSYLKANFKSYWKSSYKGSLSPIKAWESERIMRTMINFRIGNNRRRETFNFSLHQLVRGLSALRLTVSFFKPILAASIYKHFIGDHDNPTVFDPCCGFGGRMLGFKSLYPNGTYIGCEPNVETFNELQELSKNFTNVQIYNCKIEDFDVSLLPDNLDLTFTSIPYFDLETYSNPVEYESFDEWQKTFLDKIKSLPNLVLNIPNSLLEYFPTRILEYDLLNNSSHFDTNDKYKTEKIIKL